MDRPLQAERDTIRIPVFGEEDITTQSTYHTPFGQGQEFINCIAQYETSNTGQEGSAIIQKRPGISATSVDFSSYFTGNGTPRDHIVITQLQDVNIVALFDHGTNTIYIIEYLAASNLTYKLGEITGASWKDYVFLSELNIAGNPTLGVVWTKFDKSTSKGFYASTTPGVAFAASSLTEITDTDFPPKQVSPKILTGAMVQMNQTTYVMTLDGYIYNSDQNSITSWDTLGNIQTYAYPDRGIGLVRYKNHIVAMSEDSIEFFNDIGNPPPGSPLQRTDQAFIKFGCVDPRCMINIDDRLYWIAASSNGTDGLWRLEGYTPTKISNAKRDMQIGQAYNLASQSYNIFLKAMVINGTTNIIITGVSGKANVVVGGLNITGYTDNYSPSQNEATYRMLCYCVDYGTWWGFTDCENIGYNVLMPCGYYPIQGGSVQNKYLQFFFKGYSGSGVPANLYTLESTDTYNTFHDQIGGGGQTTSNAVTAIIQFPPIEFVTVKRKFMPKLSVSMDIIDTTETSGSIYVVYTKDDNTGAGGITRQIIVPNTANRYYVNRLGHARKVQFALVSKTAFAWKVRALELDVFQGTG